MDTINKLYEDNAKKQEIVAKALEERATALHTQLLGEMRSLNHDPFAREFSNRTDSMVLDSMEVMRTDISQKGAAGGPSIRRLKFHPSYWKHWHGEKTLLDQISRERHAQIESEKNTKPVMAMSARIEKQRKERAAFACANSRSGRRLFDQHLLGDTSVAFLVQESLGQTVADDVSLDPACNVVFPTLRVRSGIATTFSRAQKSGLPHVARCDTSSCDIPPLPSAFDKERAVAKGAAFRLAPRFPKVTALQAAAGPSIVATSTCTSSSSALPPGSALIDGREGFRFAESERFLARALPGSDSVGPAAYTLPRLMDPDASRREELQRTLAKYRDSRDEGLVDWSAQELCGLGKLGQHCIVEEHVLFGMCRDRRCLRRSLFEQTTVAAGDRIRLRGHRPNDFFAAQRRAEEQEKRRGKYTYPKDLDGQAAGENDMGPDVKDRLQSSDEAYLCTAWPLLPEPIYAMTALYAAAAFDDVATIRTLGELGVDPNVLQPDTGYSPLHIAAVKRHTKAVRYLLHYFHDEAVVLRDDSRWLRINARDRNGNTALHFASSHGCKDIVALLCQEVDIDPECKNLKGETPLDLIGNHSVYSYLQLAIERVRLERKLQDLRTAANSQATTQSC